MGVSWFQQKCFKKGRDSPCHLNGQAIHLQEHPDTWEQTPRAKDSWHLKRLGGKEKCKRWNNYVPELCFLSHHGTKLQPVSKSELDSVNLFMSTFLKHVFVLERVMPDNATLEQLQSCLYFRVTYDMSLYSCKTLSASSHGPQLCLHSLQIIEMLSLKT